MVVFATIMVVGVGVGGAVAKWSQSASVSMQVSTGTWVAPPNPNACSMDRAPVSAEVWTKKDYPGGSRVLHDGKLFLAGWYANSTDTPGGLNNSAWQEIATNAANQTLWTPTRIFDTPDVVCHGGALWTANWYSRNITPGSNGAWRRNGA